MGQRARGRHDLLNVDIVYDLRPVHGDSALATRFIDHAYDRGHAEPVVREASRRADNGRQSLHSFWWLQLEDGRLDIKKHGLFPIVATARTLAIRHGIRERSTRARLEGLIALDIGGDRDMKTMLSGHALLLGLLLGQQIRDIYAGIPVSNRVGSWPIAREQQASSRC